MKLLKKSVAYVLAFVTVFSSFTILPSEFFNMADVSAVELTAEASTVIATNQNEITVEEPTTTETNNDEITVEESTKVETNKDEITAEKTIAVENNKNETTAAKSNAEATYTEGDFTYSIINDNEVEIVDYNGSYTDVVIPDVTTGSECSELANKKVTAIGNRAFYYNRIPSITFGKNIKSIGYDAFYNTLLTEVDMSICTNLTSIGNYAFAMNSELITLILPDSLQTIGNHAFYKCNKLTAVETGSNLTNIDDYAFQYCSNLKTVHIKGGNNATIGSKSFSNCNKLENVTIGNGVKNIASYAFEYSYSLINLSLGDSVETIEDYAFHRCMKLKELTITNSVKTIGSYAFADNSYLKNITIGSGCTNIASDTFTDTPLENITVSEDNTKYASVDGILLNKDKTTILLYPNARSNNTYTIPNTVTAIGAYAFEGNLKLTEVTIGDNVETIGAYAFASCTKLSKIAFGKNITFIGDYAFNFNITLTELDLSVCTKLEKIGKNAFSSNSKVTKLILPNSLQAIGEYAFRWCSGLTSLEINCNITRMDLEAFGGCNNLKTVNITGGQGASIGRQTFYSCEKLESVIIGDGVSSIDDFAFGNCPNLKRIKLGNAVRYIEDNAFDGDTALENITVSADNKSYASVDGVLLNKAKTAILFYPKGRIGAYTTPNTVKEIVTEAFMNCNNLTKLTVSEGATKIDNYAFCKNSALKTVILPKSLEIIGAGAFKECKELTTLEIGGNLAKIESGAFIRCNSLKTVNIKSGNNTTIDINAFAYCDSLEIVNIGNGVNEIKPYAFSNCTNLEKAIIGETVKTIGEYVFNNCNALKTVQIFSNNLTTLYNNSIPNNNTCTIYCYENSTTHNTLKDNGYTNLKFFATEVQLTDITVNGISIDSFNTGTKYYTVYVDYTANITIAPVFKDAIASYTVTNENYVYTLNIFDGSNNVIDTYKITLKEHGYTVTGDITLTLDNISTTKVGGSIALPAGTYKLKIAKGSTQFGYNKTVTDYCSGLTLSEKFTSYITLNATGGTYTFQFDTVTNKLVIKHDKNMPNEYLIGDIDTILKPMGNRPLSIGTQYLPAGTYKFKLSIGGKEYGYGKVVDDATAGSLSLSTSYSSQITLNTTGGMYTFVLNTETNRLIIRHTPTENEDTTDVHISGTFNLVLKDKSATGEELTTATGTIALTSGCYTFKVYNYGTVYTSGAVINDKATKNLSNKYTTPVTLNATGGTYKFTFNKVTGALDVSLLG